MEKTIISVETIDGEKMCHFMGYGYLSDIVPSAQLVEYCGFYLPLSFVVERGMAHCESEYGPEVKQYITDLMEEELIEVYNTYDNGNAPVPMDESAMSMAMPEGVYIIPPKN